MPLKGFGLIKWSSLLALLFSVAFVLCLLSEIIKTAFYVLLTVHLSTCITLENDQIDAQFFYFIIRLLQSSDRLCGLVVRVSGYRYRGLRFDSRRYQIF